MKPSGSLVLFLLGLAVPASAQTTAYAVVSNNGDNTVSIIDTRTEQVIGQPIAVVNWPNSVSMSPDGRRAYVTHGFREWGAVTVIDVTGHRKEAEIATRTETRDTAVSPNNRWVYVLDRWSSTMSVIDAETLVMTPFTATVGKRPECITVTPDGQYAYVGNGADLTVSVVQLTLPTLPVVATIPMPMEPVDIAIAPDGRTVYVRVEDLAVSGAIIPVDVATNTAGVAIAVDPLGRIALTHDGALLYATGGQQNARAVTVVETSTGNVVAGIPLNDGWGLATTPNGAHVYVVDRVTDSVAIVDQALQSLTGRSIQVGLTPAGIGMSPPVIVATPGTVTSLSIARDSDLTALAFDRYVPFNGGTLTTTGTWTTTRTLSLLNAGGTLDTGPFSTTLNGGTTGSGQLTKKGTGTLALLSASRHASTVVREGTFRVMSVHGGDIVIAGGTLTGLGSLGRVTSIAGTIAPGSTIGPGTMYASNVTMSTSTDFNVGIVNKNSDGYSRLDATGSVTLGNASLKVSAKFAQIPGTTFTIVTNAVGTFANYAEGDVVVTPRGSFTITYQGGVSGHDVVLTAM